MRRGSRIARAATQRSSDHVNVDVSRTTEAVDTTTGTIKARVWEVSVGRNRLLLLDSNVDGNQPEDRQHCPDNRL